MGDKEEITGTTPGHKYDAKSIKVLGGLDFFIEITYIIQNGLFYKDR